MCTVTATRQTLAFMFSFAFLMMAHVTSASLVHAEMVDRVVAVVNDDVITLSDLEREGETTFRKIAASSPPEQREAHLAAARAEILDTLIDKHLITQKAASKKITVSDKEVDAAFANVLQRTRLSREQLIAKLEESGIDEAIYRSTLRTQLLQNKLVGADISSRVVITEEMILDYYDNKYVSRQAAPAAATVDGEYYLLQIGCSWQNSGREKARKKIEQAWNQAKAGEDFGRLARQFSDLPSSADGGDIGSFALDDMNEQMQAAVRNLGPGEVSDIIETEDGYQFFKVLSGASSAPVSMVAKEPYEKVKEAIRQELFEQEMKKAYAQWVKELKGQAYIQKL